MSGKKLGIAGRLYTGQLSYDFMKNRKLWFIISGVIIGASVLAPGAAVRADVLARFGADLEPEPVFVGEAPPR